MSTRRYGHFCPMARALELIGDRWSLLLVRDLLRGRQRFTDLLGLCAGITPRQLTIGLRRLEDAGVVARDESGRQVWYQLTPSGQELAPAIDDLLVWGLRHATGAPAPDEPVHAEHVLYGTLAALNRAEEAPPAPVTWMWRFPDGTHTLHWDGTRWRLDGEPGTAPDVVIDTTPRDWAEFVTTPGARRTLGGHVNATGEHDEVAVFARAFLDR